MKNFVLSLVTVIVLLHIFFLFLFNGVTEKSEISELKGNINIPPIIDAPKEQKLQKMKLVKKVKSIIKAESTYEGDGFLVHRTVGTRSLRNLDPFLMLDEFGPIDYKPNEAKGASWHPHRGFETVTYILKGEMKHQDSLGNSEWLRQGDVQWMTAGGGIIHDESPSPDLVKLGGSMHGFQLWVNLPKKLKMCTPNYNGLKNEEIPKIDFEGGYLKLITGEYNKVKSIINTQIPIEYFDVHLEKKDSKFLHTIPKDHNSFLYVYAGSIEVNEKKVERKNIIVFEQDENPIEVIAKEDGTKFLFLSGQPIKEPIVQYGPFVMNTQDEIYQAIDDYQKGKFAKQATISHKVEHKESYKGDK